MEVEEEEMPSAPTPAQNDEMVVAADPMDVPGHDVLMPGSCSNAWATYKSSRLCRGCSDSPRKRNASILKFGDASDREWIRRAGGARRIQHGPRTAGSCVAGDR